MTADLEKLVKKGVNGLQDMLDQYADKNAYEGFPAMLRDGLAAIEALRAALDPDAVAAMVQEAVKAEREACASVAVYYRDICGECHWPEEAVIAGGNVANDIAAAIHTRGEA